MGSILPVLEQARQHSPLQSMGQAIAASRTLVKMADLPGPTHCVQPVEFDVTDGSAVQRVMDKAGVRCPTSVRHLPPIADGGLESA